MRQQDANYLRSCINYSCECLQLMFRLSWASEIAMLTGTFYTKFEALQQNVPTRFSWFLDENTNMR